MRYKNIAIYAGSFDPWCNHHQEILDALVASEQNFDHIYVWPVGAYSRKQQVAPPKARIDMIQGAMARYDRRRVSPRLSDLTLGYGYTSTFAMQMILRSENGADVRVTHVVGADVVPDIKTEWNDGILVWLALNFLIVPYKDLEIGEWPINSKVLQVHFSNPNLSARDVRSMIAEGVSGWENNVPTTTRDVINTYNLYR